MSVHTETCATLLSGISLIRSSKGVKKVVRLSGHLSNWKLSLTHFSLLFLLYTPLKTYILLKHLVINAGDGKGMKFPCKLNFKKNAKMVEIRNIICK